MRKPEITQFYTWSDFAQKVIPLMMKVPNQTYRGLARQLGFTSPNFIQMLASGKRMPSSNTVRKICLYCGYTEIETNYFVLLTERDKNTDPFIQQVLSKELDLLSDQISKL